MLNLIATSIKFQKDTNRTKMKAMLTSMLRRISEPTQTCIKLEKLSNKVTIKAEPTEL